MNKKNNREIIIDQKTHFVICKQMHDVLIGTLLGDGNLASGPEGKTWSYRALHSEDAKKYLFHKYDIFQECCLSPPAEQEFKGDKRTAGKKYKRWYFNTRRLGIFKFYGDLFYTRSLIKENAWTKTVPVTIEQYLNPTALAYWFMDDSDQKWKGHKIAVRISTTGFTENECLILQQAFSNRYGLKVSLHKDGKSKLGRQQYRLFIPKASFPAFKDIVLPNILPSMLYKLPGFE